MPLSQTVGYGCLEGTRYEAGQEGEGSVEATHGCPDSGYRQTFQPTSTMAGARSLAPLCDSRFSLHLAYEDACSRIMNQRGTVRKGRRATRIANDEQNC